MSESTEREQFNLLYEYIKKDVLEYTPEMKLPKFMIYRLRGLRDGKFMVNKHKPEASYTYEQILLTFKACKPEIMNYAKNRTFEDEQHKFNYILVIIENNINDIVLRLKNRKQQINRVESMDVSSLKREVESEYKKKSKEVKNSRLDDLW